MQDEFLRLQGVLNKTILFITHDFDEALRLADRIAIMKDGLIEQLDTPANIVLNPKTEYVRKFTEEVPREKVLKIEAIMDKSINEKDNKMISVSKDAIIETVAEKILSQENSVNVLDANNNIVGSVKPSKIIQTVFRTGKEKSQYSMEIIKKYPKAIQWIFLFIIFFGLCFAIQIPEGYEFAKAGTEFIDKDKLDQTKYSVFWRLPAFIAWMPGWINDSVYFLLNEWFPIEYFDSSIQETKSRPLVLHITRLISSSMLFLIQFIREILIGGVDTIVAFTSWDFLSANPWAKLPGLPWTIVALSLIHI